MSPGKEKAPSGKGASGKTTDAENFTPGANESLQAAALEYAALGWRVFPVLAVSKTGACECEEGSACERPGKHPAIKAWNKDATTDKAQIQDWWRERPERGIGIATGEESNLTVLDVDGDEGVASLGKLSGAEGMPVTPCVQSRPGRFHYYFTYEPSIKSKANTLGAKLDTRSDGGYVVAPPSRHATGVPYTWLQRPSKVELAPWPEFLNEQRKKEEKRERPQKERFRQSDEPKLVSALEYVDADDEERWSQVGWILGRAYRQSDHGFAIYQTWAAKSKKFNPKKTKGHYYEGSKKPRDNPLTTATIFKWATEAGWYERIFNKSKARIDLGEKLAAPQWIIEGFLPFGTAGGHTGEGGAHKTTLLSCEAIHIALGRPFLGYTIQRPGAVLFVSAEDDKASFAYRLQQIARAMGLTADEIAKVEASIFIEDLSGTMRRLVEADQYGHLSPTAMGEDLIQEYRDAGLVLVVFDPTNLLGPGERFVNDGEAALMAEGQRIARALSCTSLFVHHIAKSAARSGDVDQYTGRGGAAFADNSRFMHHLTIHEDNDKQKYSLPKEIDAAALAEGRVLRLHVTKLSWAARPRDPIFIVRDGWAFKHYAPAPTLSKSARADEDRWKVWEYVRASTVNLSRKQLVDERWREVRVGRNRLSQVVDEMVSDGQLAYADLPSDERRGQRTRYLKCGPSPAPDGAPRCV
jgi:hypothetical protein